MNNFVRKIRTLRKILFIKKHSYDVKKYDDEKYNAKLYELSFGRKGDFINPKTFNEHIINLKLYANEKGFEFYTDKYSVRDYVVKTVGEKYLNEVYDIYDNAEEIDFSKLPDKFALKGTHGSGYNVIVTDKSAVDANAVKNKFKEWLKENYYYIGRERNYKYIIPRVVCEKYLSTKDNSPLNEIKLMCFHGKVKLISDNRVYNGKRCVNLYDWSKAKLDVRMGADNHKFDLPKNIDEMISVAEKLSEPFEFVRVDLYNVDGKIVFSELTFHSGGGFVQFYPDSWDLKLGSLFD